MKEQEATFSIKISLSFSGGFERAGPAMSSNVLHAAGRLRFRATAPGMCLVCTVLGLFCTVVGLICTVIGLAGRLRFRTTAPGV